jgi:hypothetical protein
LEPQADVIEGDVIAVEQEFTMLIAGLPELPELVKLVVVCAFTESPPAPSSSAAAGAETRLRRRRNATLRREGKMLDSMEFLAGEPVCWARFVARTQLYGRIWMSNETLLMLP